MAQRDDDTFELRTRQDGYQFGLIVSPEDATRLAELREFTRALMVHMERGLATGWTGWQWTTGIPITRTPTSCCAGCRHDGEHPAANVRRYAFLRIRRWHMERTLGGIRAGPGGSGGAGPGLRSPAGGDVRTEVLSHHTLKQQTRVIGAT